jgi:hypothetical protein
MEVPLLIIGFNRPDLLAKRLDEVFSSFLIPNSVTISIDGGDVHRNEMKQVLDIYSEKYPFKVISRDENLGCSKHILKAVTEILEKNLYVVVLEDDVSISPQFMGAVCQELVKLGEHSDVATVGAFSPFAQRNNHFNVIRNYWRKTNYFSAWGWGTSKYFWDSFIQFPSTEELTTSLEKSRSWQELNSRKKRIWMSRFERQVWDYQVQFNLFAQDKLNLLPYFRLIDNEGFSDSRSTHTKHRRPWNLFGLGYSASIPALIQKESIHRRIVWKFLDANLWAADGILNARGREKGVRTLLKELFSR